MQDRIKIETRDVHNVGTHNVTLRVNGDTVIELGLMSAEDLHGLCQHLMDDVIEYHGKDMLLDIWHEGYERGFEEGQRAGYEG